MMEDLSGPAIHTGVAAALALVFRLNPAITIFGGLLPDLLDKPLAAFGIGGGRFIGHTLLFALVVATAFFFWEKRFAPAALAGVLSHLLLDMNALVPWFYPFKHYDFYHGKFDFLHWLAQYVDISQMGYEVIITAAILFAVLSYRWLRRRSLAHRHPAKGKGETF